MTGMRKMPLFLFAVLMFAASCSGIVMDRTDLKKTLTPEEHLRLGAIYESRGETGLALREYADASDLAKDNTAACFAMGNLNLKLKRYKEAQANYIKCVRINPADGAFHNNLGWAYMEYGDLDRAEAEVKEALRVDYRRAYIFLDTLGMIHMRRNHAEEAEKAFEEAASLAPGDEKAGLAQIYRHLFELYIKTGNSDKAAELEEKIQSLK